MGNFILCINKKYKSLRHSEYLYKHYKLATVGQIKIKFKKCNAFINHHLPSTTIRKASESTLTSGASRERKFRSPLDTLAFTGYPNKYEFEYLLE